MRAFPRYSANKVKRIKKSFYQNFCDTIVESLKAATIPEEEISRRVRFLNPEIIEMKNEKKRSILFYASHHFNWEWMALASNANLGIPADVVYKPLRNKRADRFIYHMRSRFGSRPIPGNRSVRSMIRLKGQHRIIGLVADQSPPREHVYWAYFLGIETDFYPGLVQLPYLLQVPAVFGKIDRVNRGYYEVEIIKIGEPPYQKSDLSVLKNYIRETERLIENHPENYLWSHNRWKHVRRENEKIINFPDE